MSVLAPFLVNPSGEKPARLVGVRCLEQPDIVIKTAADITVSYRLSVSMVGKEPMQSHKVI